MGMSNKGVLALAGMFVLGVVALVAPQSPLSVTGDDKAQGQNQSAEMVNVNSYGIDGKISFPTTPSSADVYLFKAEPENYGDYADWDAGIATDGLEQGIDYHKKTGVTTDTVKFDDLESAKYFLVVDDSNYNTVFAEVTQPDQVKKVFADNDKAVKLASGPDMDTAATYGSDNVVSYDSNDNVLATGTDLPAPTQNTTETVTIERSVDVDTGTSYLASLTTSSFNSNDGIDAVKVWVEADGEQIYSKDLKDGSSGDLSDGTSFGEDLRDKVDSNPVEASDDILVVYEVEAQMNTQSSVADNGKLEDGESILTTGMDDVYSSDVSTASKAYTR